MFSLWRKLKLFIACKSWAAFRSDCPLCLNKKEGKHEKWKMLKILNKSYYIYNNFCLCCYFFVIGLWHCFNTRAHIPLTFWCSWFIQFATELDVLLDVTIVLWSGTWINPSIYISTVKFNCDGWEGQCWSVAGECLNLLPFLCHS